MLMKLRNFEYFAKILDIFGILSQLQNFFAELLLSVIEKNFPIEQIFQ